jgi:hypothetical protein
MLAGVVLLVLLTAAFEPTTHMIANTCSRSSAGSRFRPQ